MKNLIKHHLVCMLYSWSYNISFLNILKPRFIFNQVFYFKIIFICFFTSKGVKEAEFKVIYMYFHPTTSYNLILYLKNKRCVRKYISRLLLNVIWECISRLVQRRIWSLFNYFMLWLTLDIVHHDIVPKVIMCRDVKPVNVNVDVGKQFTNE